MGEQSTTFDQREYACVFAGHERVLHNADAIQALPREMARSGYEKAFIVCSKTLNTKTEIIRDLEASLGENWVATTDEVGEHAPISNVLAAAIKLRDSGADVIVGVGGGSVIDFCKMLQLCHSEGAYTKEALLTYQMKITNDGIAFGSTATPSIRQFIIPTTLATAEWTLGTTPVDEQTGLKARFAVPLGGSQVLFYDPTILSRTPKHLLLSTAIRGLDHAINTRCSTEPHPVANVLTERAISLYIENLPLLNEDQTNLEVLTNCQLATWCTAMCKQNVPDGFSKWMVHIVGPYAHVAHSDAACVLMLAQAKWLEGYADESHGAIKQAINRPDESLHDILLDLLTKLDMPLTLDDLGIGRELVEEMAGHAMNHPFVTKNNLRPITTKDDIMAVMSLAREAQ